MNHAQTPSDQDTLPDELRWQLRALRQDTAPRTDLWNGIAERIAAQPRAESAAIAAASQRRRGRAPLAWLATAAALTLAIGLGWQSRPDDLPAVVDAPAPEASRTAPVPLLAREADAMTREYQGALRELTASLTVADDPSLRQLDASAADVRAALARDPDARFLLQRLQRLYAQRLALTRRFAYA